MVLLIASFLLPSCKKDSNLELFLPNEGEVRLLFKHSEEETVGNVFNFHGKTDLVLGLKKTSTTEEPTNPENPVEGE